MILIQSSLEWIVLVGFTGLWVVVDIAGIWIIEIIFIFTTLPTPYSPDHNPNGTQDDCTTYTNNNTNDCLL